MTTKTFSKLDDQLNRIVTSAFNKKSNENWADTITEYFSDYEHVAHIKVRYPDWIFQSEQIDDWCKQCCHGEYTFAVHRVNKENPNIIDPMSLDERLYCAFKNRDDYMMFVLTWL